MGKASERFSWPASLHPLRDYLKRRGVDPDRHASARQAAYFAQQVLNTRFKFPDTGGDMMPVLIKIQDALNSGAVRERYLPEEKRAPKAGKTGKGKRRQQRPVFDAAAMEFGIHIFADGAAVPNPGTGGWGVVVYRDGAEIASACGGDPESTNNEMELTALLNAIEHGRRIGGPVTIWTDSNYCVRGVNEWMAGWKALGWHRAGENAEPHNRLLKNVDLWRAIDEALTGHAGITVQWVRGHAGIAGNERADELAEQGRQKTIDTIGDPLRLHSMTIGE